eukprot:CAMPEP_0202702008 /NCGR_PEP_ID=MMETSP1385-20130828/15053_1 /ASSEMBLY_ACC=CAM_ASM_000861 /TAXON_ID=933848 /ORGANISM="Elphidium margaritaceum" /LENGTH=532 /DNA_ID=CAMNT_0049359559 /DNA_START=132 /DNA_END=1727 /DNA_ORIENTATION=-
MSWDNHHELNASKSGFGDAEEQTRRQSETEYLINLLKIDRTETGSDALCVPLHLDTFRRARLVQGDVTLLRVLIEKVTTQKQCVKGLVFGGSCSSGHGIIEDRENNVYLKQFEEWLNEHFPCDGRHEIDTSYDSNDLGTPGTPTAFWDAAMRIGVESWNNYSCDPYNLFLFETATNSYGDAANVYYTEMLIRNILLCRNRAAIAFIQATRSEDQLFMRAKTRGDLEESKVLAYYQIPTVSLSMSLYPLSWRYYLNGLMANTSNTSALIYRLRQQHPYLFEGENRIDLSNHSNHSNPKTDIYRDSHYSNEASGGHLRVDGIHPTIACHRFLAYLLQYLFMTEYNEMQFEQARLGLDHFDIFERNQLYLQPSVNSLPPIAFLTTYSDTWPEPPLSHAFAEKLQVMTHLANHHISVLFFVNFEAPVYHVRRHEEKLKDLTTQSEGWSLRGETKWNKYGLIGHWNSTSTCKFSIRLQFDNNLIRSRYLVRMSYLEAYDQMGSAAVWIDAKPKIDDGIDAQNYAQLEQYAKVQVIDA